MSRWRDLARRLREQDGVRDNRDNRDDSTPIANFVPNVPIVPSPVSVSRPAMVPTNSSDWAASLAAIDASRLPAGFDPDHWRYLLTDALWLCHHHGQAAAALGWTASDLFGIGPANGRGGLADRLEGARNLVLTDRIAHWRGPDLEGWLWRLSLTPKPTIWEI